ncbi:hypothetical protein B9G98_01360 [Wickerhamiella sorbophila]|uniref:Uncharacterized protein n=1 Tax=Wickerhamiella sorbophila TaxID=45607 RepID=A0A2T0FFI6_9ASCO|nr:hypothetical protein B9G98_01360 [Wickerhamiella sorbophila]PRT53740.1 hypothetical protein B9G98_01360 [Wickerhamiella sorbophila]
MSEILLLFAKVPRGLNHNPTERSAFADLASSQPTWWDCEPESKSSLDEVGAQYSSTAGTVSENLEFLFDEGLSFFSDLSEQSQELSNENLLSAYNLTGPPSTLALNGSAANEVDVFVKATFPLIQPGNAIEIQFGNYQLSNANQRAKVANGYPRNNFHSSNVELAA